MMNNQGTRGGMEKEKGKEKREGDKLISSTTIWVKPAMSSSKLAFEIE
jgi:hypothetical protein